MALSQQSPRVAARFRLQYEEAQQAYVLLYPEGIIRLNSSAAEILRRCDGVKSVDSIIEELEQRFGVGPIRDEVIAFIELANGNGWLQLE